MLTRTQLAGRPEADTFLWATGIECSFISDPWPGSMRTLDEYALVEHYERLDEDLERMASLGITAARYGIPWYRINPKPHSWDWEWTDRALEGLLARGIDPIVDLVHYGVPGWLDGAFLHPDFPRYMAEYAAQVGQRYKGRIRAYTPLNEPRIAARYTGRLGWWPPYKRGWRGYVSILFQACRGIVHTCQALQEIDPEMVMIHVEGTELYRSDDTALAHDVARRQFDVFLSYDLLTGAISHDHALWPWLVRHGATEDELTWFQEHSIGLDVVGINFYPMWGDRWVRRTPTGVRSLARYGSAALVEALVTLFWERYGRPLMITETAASHSVARRIAWLDESLRGVQRLRARGIPLIGYAWYPMLDHVAWAWRQRSAGELSTYMAHMGLWDIHPTPDGRLDRIATPLVERYRQVVSRGVQEAGILSSTSGAVTGEQ